MKTCPSCRQTYEDDSLMFCLQDGIRLVPSPERLDPNVTLHLPPATKAAAPARPTVPSPQPTITARLEQFRIDLSKPVAGAADRRRNPLPWILAIVFVIGLSGIAIAWILTRSGSDQISIKGSTPEASPNRATPTPGDHKEHDSPSPTPVTSPDNPRVAETPNPTPNPTVKPTPKATPTVTRPKFAVMNNISFNGSRITYYPRPSFGLCQADCAGNPNCKGFTWIRPGAYNPGDSAMCYLMSAVTAHVPHSCCISAVKN
jgi:PAN domain